MKLLVVLAVLVLLALGLRIAIPRLGNSVAGGIVEHDGQPTLAECPNTPNCYRDEFPVTAEPTLVMSTIADIVSRQDGAQIVSQNERYLHATFTSRVMGFMDDVEFVLNADNTGIQVDTQAGAQTEVQAQKRPVVLVRSASRLGKSDLGANEKRVDMLRSAISPAI